MTPGLSTGRFLPMIRRRFIVFKGIGQKTERAIWNAGVPNWQTFLDAGAVETLTPKKYDRLRPRVDEWNAALDHRDTAFFAGNLPRAEHWHLFDTFGDSVRYLDIETTGLSPGYNDVTVVGIHDGNEFQALIRGQGLSAQSIREALDGCKLLVSYFGSGFDVPFLRAAFPELAWDIPHFDLCFAGRRLGLTGGLKFVEKELGIERPADLVEVDGFEAVRLWHRYDRAGDEAALEKLVAYNEADTANLAVIAPLMYERLCRKVGEVSG